MAEPLHVRYERVIPYPLDAAYAWLTDYQDDDPARTDEILRRRDVVERAPDRVVVDAEVETFGRWRGRVEIRLFPPDRWEARPITRRPSGTVYRYRLEPRAEGCRLVVDYFVEVRRPWKRLLARVAMPLTRRRIVRMWDGFFAAMEREVGQTTRAPPRPEPRA